jgi:hypothetical protein
MESRSPPVGLAAVLAAVAAVVVLILAPTCCAAQQLTASSDSNATLPFFSLRMSGSRWQAALATNYTDISIVVRTALSDALNVTEDKIIVVSLSVGSLVTIFLVESDTLTAADVIDNVSMRMSLSLVQALYQVAGNTTESVAIISVGPEEETTSTTTFVPVSTVTTTAAMSTTTTTHPATSSTAAPTNTMIPEISTATPTAPSSTLPASTTTEPSTMQPESTTAAPNVLTTTEAPPATNSTFPTYLMRVSGSSWQAALASNFTDVAAVVRTTLRDALNVTDGDIVVTSLSVGSLLAVFRVQSTTLSASQIVSAVRVAPLASLQAVYRAASQSNETLTLLSISADQQDDSESHSSCDDTCIVVAVVAAVVAVVLIVAVVWWSTTRLCCRGSGQHVEGKSVPTLAGYGIFASPSSAADAQLHQPYVNQQHGGPSLVSHHAQPIQQWEEEQVGQHEQAFPVHSMDYPSRELQSSLEGRGYELQHYYIPSTTARR